VAADLEAEVRDMARTQGLMRDVVAKLLESVQDELHGDRPAAIQGAQLASDLFELILR
jgi:hypothetical protein